MQDLDNGSEDIPTPVSQQGRGLDMIHLGDILVHLDEADSRLSAGNSNKTFLDDSTIVRL